MQRQNLFADPSFRSHLVWVSTLSTGTLLLVLTAAVLVPLFSRFDHASSLEELRGLTAQILELHTTLWPVVFTSLVSVFLSSWLLYRRMIAPMVRFVRVFEAVERGEIPDPLTLRATDYLRREAEALNGMLAGLRAQAHD